MKNSSRNQTEEELAAQAEREAEVEAFERGLKIYLKIADTPSTKAGLYCPPYFETASYRALVGPREPNYKKPYVFNTYSQAPSPANLASPYIRQFRHIKVLGYMEPYPFALFRADRIDHLGMPRPHKMEILPANQAVMNQFCFLDKTWGEYTNPELVKKAMDLTKQLNSSENKRHKVSGYGNRLKDMIAIALQLRVTPGLPFSADPMKKYQADYLDRAFELAIEIEESAKRNPARKVQAPPCLYVVQKQSEGGCREECMYPMAISIIEYRFMVSLTMSRAAAGRQETTTDPFPTCYHEQFSPTAEEFIRSGEFVFTAEFLDPNTGMHPDLINSAFSIIQKWMRMSPEDQKVWEFLKYYFANTPVLLPSGQLVRKRGGSTSESVFRDTALCIVRTFIGVYCMLSQGLEPKDIAGKIHCTDYLLIMFVPRSFSRDKFKQDTEDLGFALYEIQEIDNKGNERTVTKIE